LANGERRIPYNGKMCQKTCQNFKRSRKGERKVELRVEEISRSIVRTGFLIKYSKNKDALKKLVEKNGERMRKMEKKAAMIVKEYTRRMRLWMYVRQLKNGLLKSR